MKLPDIRNAFTWKTFDTRGLDIWEIHVSSLYIRTNYDTGFGPNQRHSRVAEIERHLIKSLREHWRRRESNEDSVIFMKHAGFEKLMVDEFFFWKLKPTKATLLIVHPKNAPDNLSMRIVMKLAEAP